jgi:hypothetical protein
MGKLSVKNELAGLLTRPSNFMTNKELLFFFFDSNL